ncbi:MAG TPA: peptidylprolyl isomerase [bacterium]|nr:peptidylprolyl isomerase [bacterium]
MGNKKLWILALAALLWAPPLWAKLVDGIAVIANHEVMTQGELEESIQAYFIGQGLKVPPPKSPDYAKARQQVLNSFIEEVALADEADAEKIDVTDAEIDHSLDQQIDDMKKGYPTEAEFDKALATQGMTPDDLKQDLRVQLARRLKAQHMLRQKQSDLPQSLVVSDDQARQYYAQHQEDFNQAHFAIILFKVPAGSKADYAAEVKAQAQQVLQQLKAGGDFAAAAKKYSEDAGSADKGGDIGTVAKTALEPKLAKGVFATPVGALSLVAGVDGFYIVKVFSKNQEDFDAVASDIKDQLRKGNQDQALKDWVESLKKKVYVQYSKDLTDEAAADLPYDSLKAPAAAAPLTTAPGASAPVSGTLPNAVASATTIASDSVSVEKAPVYSSLPDEGNTTLDLSVLPWAYGTGDLEQNYPAGTKVDQGFPFGLGGEFGVETTLDPQLQVGLRLQVSDKFAAQVTDATGTKGVWSQNAVGLLAGPRFLLPLSDGLNLDLSALGGYYLLFGGSTAFSGTHSGVLYLDGGNFGGQLGADLEAFLDEEKTWSLDWGASYRRLVVNPTVHGGVTGYSLPSYQVDFSGFQSTLGFRFYVDK